MAREQATTTLSPLALAIGKGVYYEDALAVIKQLNWTYGYTPQVHLSLATGDDTWSANTVGMMWMTFRATASGLVEVIRQRIKIQPEVVNITCGARCNFSGTDTGDVKFTIGGGTVTKSFALADNANELTGTIATSSSGTGWQTLTIELERTAGTTAAIPRMMRVQDEAITSGLPAPQNE